MKLSTVGTNSENLRPGGNRRKVIVVDREAGTKTTYSSSDEKLLDAAEADAKKRGMAAKKPRSRKSKTTNKTDSETK